MTPISLALNLLLAGLLLLTLMFGWILNQRLKALKDSHSGFADAVGDLDRAAQRAETGLVELRATTDQAVDLLIGRIEKARELAERLEKATVRAEAAADKAEAVRPSAPVRSIFDRPRAGPAAAPAASFRQTSDDEAMAAAEALILRLSESEVLTTSAPAARDGRPETRRGESRLDAMRRPEPQQRAAEPRAERMSDRLAQRAEARERDRDRGRERDRDIERDDLHLDNRLDALFEPPPRGREDPRPEPRRREAPRDDRAEARAEPAYAARPEPRAHPRSRAQIDDDLFDPPARGGRLRAFDGGLS